ncbi:ABC transporter permease [Pseudolactococcus plantarum]|uniref:ABC transporter permease n=1 Tax=Pseudolactococcus plantarum TaxID=1365 RepID=UPI000835D9E2|nr:ABC transporter permease [Lactococcus plantarum]HCN74878.1 ABC transporter permease [Lactococcus sp.]
MFNQLKLVAGQVYRVKIKTPSFWLIVLSPLLLPIIGGLIGFLVAKGESGSPTNLAIVNNTALVQTIKTGKLIDAKLTSVADIGEAKKQLKDDKIDGYLVKSSDEYTLITASNSGSKFDQTKIQNALTQISMAEKAAKLNLKQEDLIALQTPAKLTMKTQSDKGETSGGNDKNMANYFVSLGIGVVIFMLLTFYTSMMAQEIANEKSNRIMEILLAATSAKIQYYGKIIGISLLVATHLLTYVVLGGVAAIVLKGNKMVKGMTQLFDGVDISFLVIAAIMLILGVISYLVLTAIIASIVNDQSQVQQAVQPIIYLSMIGYVASFASSSMPTNMVIKVLSFLPFVSPSLMPSRLAIQYASITDAIIAGVLQLLALILIAKFGEKVYAKNVLSYSDEKVFKQFMRNLKK